MAGGLLQLVAYGSQDIYLTGNPQITFFKIVYRRHTNFSIESIKQTFNGTANFGQEVSSTIQRNADLIYKMYLQTTLPSVDISKGIEAGGNQYKAFRWLNWIGHILIKFVEIKIGGQRIDKHYGEWLHIWNELTQQPGKMGGYAEMVGNVPKLTQIHSSNVATGLTTSCETGAYTLYIPLQFWFCRNVGMALPLIALQYHDIVVNIEFQELDKCIWATSQNEPLKFISSKGQSVIDSATSLSKTNLYVDYIYLDTDERRRFAQVSHEYLIEQLQFSGEETLSGSGGSSHLVKLNFIHPVKEIIWTIQPTNFIESDYSQSRAGRQYFNYTDQCDYTNFTGTPEPSFGPGLIGGKNIQNLWYGLPTVNVNGNLKNASSNTFLKTDTSVSYSELTSKNTIGYNNIVDYNNPGTINNYSNRHLDNMYSSYNSTTNHSIFNFCNNQVSLLDNGKNPTTLANIVLNGNERFSARAGEYFNLVQPYQHHTNCPAPGINVYSFALSPEDHQPSGTCNFSKIDNAFLNVTLTSTSTNSTINSGNSKIKIYAINYNILRIMSGMGGLAYSS